jgi:DNA-binding GntR family transcriptional regulator
MNAARTPRRHSLLLGGSARSAIGRVSEPTERAKAPERLRQQIAEEHLSSVEAVESRDARQVADRTTDHIESEHRRALGLPHSKLQEKSA